MEPSQFAAMLPPHVDETIRQYIRDDAPSFDVGGLIVGTKTETARLMGKSDCVLAGVPFAEKVFQQLGCTVEWQLQEGARVEPVQVVALVRGPANRLLLGERTALNILSRASGIATQAKRMAAIKAENEWHGEVAGTRKTTPGFRTIEKYALLVGGCSTHRIDLSTMVMLKDNHIWSAGGITSAVRSARTACGFSCKIEVEARSLEEAREAATAGADVVMLDNFGPEGVKAAAKQLKAEFPHLTVEASGGITEATLASFMSEDVDVVSMGKLTQGYPAMDFSLKVTAGQGGEALDEAAARHAREGGAEEVAGAAAAAAAGGQ